MSYSGSNATMETSAPLVNGIVNNALFNQPTHESDVASDRSHFAF